MEHTSREHPVCDPAISAYKEVFSKDAMEGPSNRVSKVEAHADKVGKFEGNGTNVGKSGRSTGKIEGVGKLLGKCEEDTVGKVEHMGKSVGEFEGKSVDKTEGTGGETVGKSVGKAETENAGKLGENTETGKVLAKVGGDVGKLGKTEGTEGETVDKSVGNSETEYAGKLGENTETGKVEGDVGKVTGKSVGKAEEGDVGKVGHKSVGKDEDGGVVKASQTSIGKGEDGVIGKASQKSFDQEVGKAGGSIQNQTVGKISNTKENSKEFVISVAGKSESEVSFGENLTAAGELKLPEGATLVAYELAVLAEGGFRVDVFMDQLLTRQFGRLLLYARQLPSTHTLLSQNCKNLPVGTLSVADVQFQGKGRAGNSWESPKGCLMFSFTLQMSDGRAVPFLQYVVSLAVIEGIESHCISKGLNTPEVRIKWPNDLYAKGLKVGGVLCTSTYSSKMFNIVVGVGLNVGNRQPTTCLDALLEEINENAPCLSKDELLAAIMSKFENLFEVFCSQGFFALESDYYDRWLHSGQTVVLEERKEGSSEVSHVPLQIQGLTPSGYLRAVDEVSEIYELHPDGNSFDFLKGLMRKKM